MTEEIKKTDDASGSAPEAQPPVVSADVPPAREAQSTALAEAEDQETPTSRKHNEEPSDDSVAFNPADWQNSTAEVANEKQTKTRLAKGQKTRPVVFYIGVMFFVALALLLLSFFMQQRNHEAVLQGLSESAINVQNLQSLEKERDELRDKLEALEPQLKQLQDEIKRLEEALKTTKAELDAARGTVPPAAPAAPTP